MVTEVHSQPSTERISTYGEYFLWGQVFFLPSPQSPVKVKVLVSQSCLTLCNPMDYILPGSSVHGILQARILEWVAIPFSRGSSPPRDRTHFCFFCIGRRVLYRLSHLGNPIISLLWVKWEFISINGKKTTHCLSMLRPSLIGSGMEKCKGISGEPNKMSSNWANPGVQEEYWEVLDSEEGQCILRFLSQVCPYCSLPLLTLSTDPTLIHPTSISPECDCPAWLPCPQSHPTASFWQRSQWWFKK